MKTRRLRLHRETIRTISDELLRRAGGGGLHSVKVGCVTEQVFCNSDLPNCSAHQSCPNHCVTNGPVCG